jgi:hypothetical protein
MNQKQINSLINYLILNECLDGLTIKNLIQTISNKSLNEICIQIGTAINSTRVSNDWKWN